jgi:putative transposase
VKVHPFVEAEKVAGHSVQRCCDLLEVSLAAFYQRLTQTPSAKQRSDAELTEQIKSVHDESKGTYGSPRVHRALRKQGVECGKRRVGRLMRIAGLEGRCKRRWRKTTIADPAAEAALDLIQRQFGPGAEIDRQYVGDITYSAQFPIMCSRRTASGTMAWK